MMSKSNVIRIIEYGIATSIFLMVIAQRCNWRRISDASGVLMFLLCGLIFYFAQNTMVERFKRSNVLYFISFLVALVPSCIFSFNVERSFHYAWLISVYWAFPFLASLFISDREIIRKLLAVIVFFLLGEGLWSCYLWAMSSGYTRVGGFSFGVNIFGYCIVSIMPLLFVESIVCKDDHQIKRWVLMVMLYTGICAIITTGSRSCWLATIIIFMVVGIFFIRSSRQLLCYVLPFALMAVLFCGNVSLRERLSSVFDTTSNLSNVARICLWEDAYKMFKEKPFTGIGIWMWDNHFVAIHKKYSQVKYKGMFSNECAINAFRQAHNNILHLLAESGIFGCLGYLSLILAFCRKYWGQYKKSQNKYGFIALCTILALNLTGLFDANIIFPRCMVIFWGIIGCLNALADECI